MEFVLVHGAWQGGWAWAGVAGRLRDAGHRVFAPTLRGAEADHPGRAAVTLAAMGEGLVEDIQAAEPGRFVLVAHSAGGPVAQFAADRLAEKVKRVVFADAFVLRDGECVNDLAPRENVAEGEAAKNADGTIPMYPGMWSELFTNGAATPAPLVPIPARWVTDRVTLPRFWKAELPSSYVFFTDDRSAPRASFEAMAARLGDPRRVECAGPHEALLTHPDAVAEALLIASKD